MTSTAYLLLCAGADTVVNTACSGSGEGDVASKSAVEAACLVTDPPGHRRQNNVSGTLAHDLHLAAVWKQVKLRMNHCVRPVNFTMVHQTLLTCQDA